MKKCELDELLGSDYSCLGVLKKSIKNRSNKEKGSRLYQALLGRLEGLSEDENRYVIVEGLVAITSDARIIGKLLFHSRYGDCFDDSEHAAQEIQAAFEEKFWLRPLQ